MDKFLGKDGDYYYKISTNYYKEDISIFKFFLFPILDFTRAEMKNYSIKNGFFNIMKQTWFCHKPINGLPCGLCNPCKHAIKEGFAYRLPLVARLRYRFRFIYSVKTILKGLTKKFIPAKYYTKLKKIF